MLEMASISPVWNYCVIHWEALGSREIPQVLMEAVETVYLKGNHRLAYFLKHFIQKLELLIPTYSSTPQFVGFSQGKILNRAYEYRNESHTFLIEKKISLRN